MKAIDLRIGNYFKADLRVNQPLIVEAIDEYYVNLIETREGVYDAGFEWKDVKPILITDDWLIKLGFIKLSDCWCHKIIDSVDREDPLTQLDYADGMFNINAPCAWDGGYSIKCEHVHTLQNIYFILTGEALLIE